MYLCNYNKLLLLFLIINTVKAVDFDDLKAAFKNEACIEGSMLSLESLSDVYASPYFLIKDNTDTLLNTTDLNEENVKEQNYASKINEIAQINGITYHYELLKEEGPSHDKIFHILLMLGDEEHTGSGKSLKKARRAAAQSAFENTAYFTPPSKEPKEISESISDKNTPTVLLNNAAAKLGIAVSYEVLDEIPIEENGFDNSYTHLTESTGKSYLTRLNYTAFHGTNIEENKNGHPFAVRVQVGDRHFTGIGHTVQAARHDAALKAIAEIKRRAIGDMKYCTVEGLEKECKQRKDSLKSPVSLVYELSQKHGLNVNFEIIQETGKDHEKRFVTQCKLGNFVVKGTGKSKKESKRKAAEEMLKNTDLSQISDLDNAVAMMADNKNKKKKKKNKKKVIKNQIDKLQKTAGDALSSMFQYVSDIAGNENDDKKKPKPKHKPVQKDMKTTSLTKKDELLRLTQSFGITTQFFNRKGAIDNHYTLVFLSTKPPYICFGEAITDIEADEKAAIKALDWLHKHNIDILEAQEIPKSHLEKEYFEAIKKIEVVEETK